MKWFFEMLLNGDFGEINEEQREGATQVLEKNNHLICLPLNRFLLKLMV